MGLCGDREDKLVTAGDDQVQTKFAVEFDEPWIIRTLAALQVVRARGLKVQTQCGNDLTQKTGGRPSHVRSHRHYRGVGGGKAQRKVIFARDFL